MFMNYSKNQVINMLESEVNVQLFSNDRKQRCKGKINLALLEMVKSATLEKYTNLALTSKGFLNKGYVVERLVLDYNQKASETPYCEVKYFGNDTPNVLVNNETRLIYIVVNKASLQGAFIIRNMQAVRGQRLTLEYLLNNNLINDNNRCKKLENYLGL